MRDLPPRQGAWASADLLEAFRAGVFGEIPIRAYKDIAARRIVGSAILIP
jgi:hypothetical protein